MIVRGIPVRRIERVSLLGRAEPLRFDSNLEVQLRRDDLGELIISAPGPTTALIDVIAVDFDGPIGTTTVATE